MVKRRSVSVVVFGVCTLILCIMYNMISDAVASCVGIGDIISTFRAR